MTLNQSVFHTKHDFTPELGWAAFQLLSETDSSGITSKELQAIARTVASPLSKRSDLSKILGALQELGIVDRKRENIFLSPVGMALSMGLGQYEMGFRAAVHCVYSWKWLWDRNIAIATPSWSYREVCRQILVAGVTGIAVDDIVLRVVLSAGRFNVDKVSFSRSSVAGVTTWLEAQLPPLIQRKGANILIQTDIALAADTIRLHLAALCALNSGEAILDPNNLQLLAECLLLPPESVLDPIIDFIDQNHEFLLIPDVPNRVLFKESEDPFIRLIIKRDDGENA